MEPPLPQTLEQKGAVEEAVTLLVASLFQLYCGFVKAQLVANITEYLLSGGIQEKDPNGKN